VDTYEEANAIYGTADTPYPTLYSLLIPNAIYGTADTPYPTLYSLIPNAIYGTPGHGSATSGTTTGSSNYTCDSGNSTTDGSCENATLQNATLGSTGVLSAAGGLLGFDWAYVLLQGGMWTYIR
jgi:hypothetical protein